MGIKLNFSANRSTLTYPAPISSIRSDTFIFGSATTFASTKYFQIFYAYMRGRAIIVITLVFLCSCRSERPVSGVSELTLAMADERELKAPPAVKDTAPAQVSDKTDMRTKVSPDQVSARTDMKTKMLEGAPIPALGISKFKPLIPGKFKYASGMIPFKKAAAGTQDLVVSPLVILIISVLMAAAFIILMLVLMANSTVNPGIMVAFLAIAGIALAVGMIVYFSN